MSHNITNTPIELRAVEPADLDFLYLAENDAQAWSNAATVAPMSRLLLQQYIEQYQADIYSDRQLRLIATHPSCNEPIGIADLYDFDPRNSRAGVGIYITPALRNQGWGAQLLTALCHYAQSFLGIHQLYAIIAADNEPSRRVFERCAFTHVATLPQWMKRGNSYADAIMVQRIEP